MTHTEQIRRHAERRQDSATAERIDMALQTLRAFDEHTARRFLSIAGVPDTLAQNVLARPLGQTRRTRLLSSTAHDRRRA